MGTRVEAVAKLGAWMEKLYPTAPAAEPMCSNT